MIICLSKLQTINLGRCIVQITVISFLSLIHKSATLKYFLDQLCMTVMQLCMPIFKFLIDLFCFWL